MIIPIIKKYDESLFNSKFANRYLQDQRTLRIGNIISFLAPVEIDIDGKHQISDESLNFCLEIPEISNYAGVCFQRLFVANVANIVAVKYLKSDIEILNNDIIIKKEHKHGGINQVDGILSLNQIKNVNGAMLIYLGLYNKAGEKSQPRAFSLGLDIDTCNKLMDTVNENFYYLANDIFLKTAKM